MRGTRAWQRPRRAPAFASMSPQRIFVGHCRPLGAMRRAVLLLVGASGAARAACPNLCSGRGICVLNSCTCDSGFTGADCSLREWRALHHPAPAHCTSLLRAGGGAGPQRGARKRRLTARPSPATRPRPGLCPAGPAWADAASATDVAHHDYAECSNMVRRRCRRRSRWPHVRRFSAHWRRRGSAIGPLGNAHALLASPVLPATAVRAAARRGGSAPRPHALPPPLSDLREQLQRPRALLVHAAGGGAEERRVALQGASPTFPRPRALAHDDDRTACGLVPGGAGDVVHCRLGRRQGVRVRVRRGVHRLRLLSAVRRLLPSSSSFRGGIPHLLPQGVPQGRRPDVDGARTSGALASIPPHPARRPAPTRGLRACRAKSTRRRPSRARARTRARATSRSPSVRGRGAAPVSGAPSPTVRPWHTGGESTGSISHDASAADVKAALEALPGVRLVSVAFDTGAALCSSGGTATTITFHQEAGDLPALSLHDALSSTGGTPALATADGAPPPRSARGAIVRGPEPRLPRSRGRDEGGAGVQRPRPLRPQLGALLLLHQLWLLLRGRGNRNNHGGRRRERDGAAVGLL